LALLQSVLPVVRARSLGPPPLAFVSYSSPPTLPGVHSRAHRCALRSTEIPLRESRSILVVSHHPDGFLRPEVAGLLHPAASHEVRRVSCLHTPRDAVHTLRRLSPPAAAPRLRGRCPLAVRRLRGFAPLSGLVRLATVASREMPCPSLGFVPLRGPSPNRGHPRPRFIRQVTPGELRSITRTRSRAARARCRLLAETIPGVTPSAKGPKTSRRCHLGTPCHPEVVLVPRIELTLASERVRCGGSDPSAGSSLQSLSGAEVRGAFPVRAPVARVAAGRLHRPSWGS